VRLVVDTNVVVSALLWDGMPKRLMMTQFSKEILFFTSIPLLVELAGVLSRSKFRQKITGAGYSIGQLVGLYAGMANVVRPTVMPPVAPDPDDDVVIGTALAAKADFIVTGDRGLLSVVEYEGVRILSVREMMDRLVSA
jgi:putative PIN family toxin of toxin-antitoxin system